ncbi:septation protein A [Bordetella genomosp. 13]|uniref:septation protein A n=1 Tax=Bordetella genomosp. 13 TaxID=463040 RepID=UPI0011A2BFC9|nr:septation protein A [Bordetella genomosp. 13]
MKKFLFDLFPLFLFFAAYKFADLYVATGVAMAASVAQVAWLRIRGKPIEATHWIGLSVILVFGGATLWLHNDAFIKWKPTVLYWLFAAVLLGARLLAGRNLMRTLMGTQIALPDAVWDKVNWAWILFFALSGVLNLYVAFSGQFTEEQWVSFKAFGQMGLMIVFVIAQSVYLGRHIRPVESVPDDKAKD